MPNVLSPRNLVSIPDNMDKTVLHYTQVQGGIDRTDIIS